MTRSAGVAGALDKSEGTGTKPKARFRWFRMLVAFLAVMLLAGYVGMAYVDRLGSNFFETGKSIVSTLEEVARAAKAGDLAKMQTRFAPDFSGNLLGLT